MDLYLRALLFTALSAAAAEVGRQIMRKAIRRALRRRQLPLRTFAEEQFEELNRCIRAARKKKEESK